MKHRVPTIAQVLSKICKGAYLIATGYHKHINYGRYYSGESIVFVIIDGEVIDRTKKPSFRQHQN